jgi:hypothetical protein
MTIYKVKPGKSVTVLMHDGTSKSLEPGEPINTDDLQDHLKERLESGDDYLSNVFEEGSDEDVENWKKGHRPEPAKDFDRMQHLEGVVLPGPGEEAQVKPAEEEAPRRSRRAAKAEEEG